MTEKPYIKLERDLHDALSSHKFVFSCGMQGEGKTYTAVKEIINNYKNTVFISDTHRLNDEINMNFMYDPKLVLNNLPDFINLIGEDFDKIPPEIQKEHGYPPCLCNFKDDPAYYLKKLNYLPRDWCEFPGKIAQEKIDTLKKITKVQLREIIHKKIIEENKKGHCPYTQYCYHKAMIWDAIQSLKTEEIHIVWLMVKAYLDTNMIDAFLKVDKPVGIIDENILGLCFEQATLSANSIRDFNILANAISNRYPSLKEIYKALKEIFMLIDSLITYNRDVDIKINAKKITKKVKELLDSFKLTDIKKWNEKFKAEALKQPHRIRKTYNIMDLIIKMLQDSEDDIVRFEANLSIDRDTPIISLFISKVEKIREIVHQFHKLIFTDALLPTVITEITKLLQIGEDYKILHDWSRRAKWKEVKVYNLKSRRGEYPKNTLLTLMHDYVSESYFTLVGLAKHMIQFEAERNRKIGLVGSMKIFQQNDFGTTIQEELASVIEINDMDVSFQHYGAAPGENTYDNVNWIILFGGYNTPERVRKILTDIVHINMDKLEYLHGVGTLLQFAHRGRPLLRPDEVSVYFLTNQIRGRLSQEKSFRDMPTIRYRKLLNFIKKNGESTTNEIIEETKKPKQSILRILRYLKRENLLKSKDEPSGRGRPDKIWYVV